MQQPYHIVFILLLILCYAPMIVSEKAVIVVPVADLIGNPLNKNTVHSYDNLPLCGGAHQFYNSCPRIHQLLFNEMVDIIEYCGDEVRIAICQLYYLLSNSTTKQVTYWTHKKNVLPLSALTKKPGNLHQFPPSVSYHDPYDNPDVITLYQPFYDPITQKTYSAGTRFVHKQDPSCPTTCTIYIFNPQTNQWITQTIAKKICINTATKTPTEKRALFVAILKSWADQKEGFIPYVWGGSSFTHRYRPESFKEHTHKTGSSVSYKQTNNCHPKTGFDCSNIIASAAHIAGIPYFFKNSFTITQSLDPLTPDDSVQEGDIIWIPGHVMVVADIHKNTLVEASSYLHGTGRVQEVPIGSVFSGVTTYNQLREKHLNAQMVQRINTRTQKIEEKMIPVKIFKMSSVWRKKGA